jgi:hypothetical protein
MDLQMLLEILSGMNSPHTLMIMSPPFSTFGQSAARANNKIQVLNIFKNVF